MALYFGLGAGVIVISHVVFSYFGFLHTDVDSARYMLSALIQSEAAIVALVVTLSLVAVQLAAQSYSARVIEVFRRTPDLWILMGIYGIAIFYGLGVLKLIEKANPQLCAKEYICLSNLEGYVSGAYYLGVFAFVALVPYIWNTLNLLKPSTVINTLAEKITKESILDAVDEKQEKSDGKDPILPIVDIIRGSMMKYDTETVIYGLRAISGRADDIFKNETFEEKEEEKISEHIFSHLGGVGNQAVSREDLSSTLESITNLYNSGKIAAERRREKTMEKAAEALQKIGEVAAEKKLDKITQRAANSLGYIGVAAAKQNISGTIQPIISLTFVGEASAKQHLDEATKQVAVSLGWIGMETAKQKIEDLTVAVIDALTCIGKITMEQNLENVTLEVIESLNRVGKVVAVQHLTKAHNEITEALSKLKEK